MHFIKNSSLRRIYPIAMFCMIGFLNTALYFSSFAFFWNYLHINYLLATSFTYIITALFQFFSNRKLTFNSSGKLLPQIFKYTTILGINYVTTFLIMRFIVSSLKLSPYIGLVFTSVSSATISFILFKVWVFKDQKAQTISFPDCS